MAYSFAFAIAITSSLAWYFERGDISTNQFKMGRVFHWAFMLGHPVTKKIMLVLTIYQRRLANGPAWPSLKALESPAFYLDGQGRVKPMVNGLGIRKMESTRLLSFSADLWRKQVKYLFYLISSIYYFFFQIGYDIHILQFKIYWNLKAHIYTTP